MDSAPIIAVVNKKDTAGQKAVFESMDNPDWKGMAVCRECHEHPEHRQVPIKAHFFERAAARYAVMRAGSDDIGR